MSDKEFMEYISRGISVGIDETNSVKLGDRQVLLPDVNNERELALYYLNEINPFLEDTYGVLNCDVLGHDMFVKLGGSFTEQGYVFEPQSLDENTNETAEEQEYDIGR